MSSSEFLSPNLLWEPADLHPQNLQSLGKEPDTPPLTRLRKSQRNVGRRGRRQREGLEQFTENLLLPWTGSFKLHKEVIDGEGKIRG